ncbi:MAG TPA: cytochrome c biogenesis protein CcsA, partial [Luteimonas sp.]|nr:cytochrome c biogenesis protein CcsA [Luteimonas sp.]
MLPEIGQAALLLALLFAVLQGVAGLAGAARGREELAAVTRPAALAQLVLVLAAYIALTLAFVMQDFSVKYVADNSNSLLPLVYRYTAVWGAHEGSLLLWALMLAVWNAAVAALSGGIPWRFRARALGVIGLVAVGFLSFMIFTSNPFERLLPAALEGHDLNPLLQDPGMIIHPPLLYIGYIGFVVPFAF